MGGAVNILGAAPSVGVQVVRANPEYDVLDHLHMETTAWLNAVRGAIDQFVDDAKHPDKNHALPARGVLAIESALEKFNGALADLIEAVHKGGV